MAVTVTSQVAVSGDDGTWHNEGAGSTSITGSTIRIGDSSGVDFNRHAWLRFPNVAVPAGATITAATIEVHATGLSGVIPQVRIEGNAADNAVAPTTRSQASALVRTTANVLWTPPSWTAPTPYASADLTTIIQEIVSRPGWTGGNAVQLILNDANAANVLGAISFDAFDGNPPNAAVLSVSYNTNTPPTANAGSDQTVGQSTTVTLHGSGTTSNGSITDYQWSQISGTSVVLSSATAQEPTFTAPATSGDLVFGLVVTDSASLQSPQNTVTISVSGAAPVANAGPDQANVEPLITVTLTGAASTGSPTEWEWRQVSGPAVTLSSTSVVSPTFTSLATTDGATLTFGLKVGNGTVFSDEDTVDVQVLPQITWVIQGGVPVPYVEKIRQGGNWV